MVALKEKLNKEGMRKRVALLELPSGAVHTSRDAPSDADGCLYVGSR